MTGRAHRMVFASALVASLVAACGSEAGSEEAPLPPSQLEIETGSPWNVDVEPTLGTLAFAEPRGPGPLILTGGTTPAEAALGFFEAHASALSLRSPRADLRLEAEGTDMLGLRYASFVPASDPPPDAVGGAGFRLTIHFDGEGRLAFLSGRYEATASRPSPSTATKTKTIRMSLGADAPRRPCFLDEGRGHGVHYYAQGPLHDEADTKTFEVSSAGTAAAPRYELRREARPDADAVLCQGETTANGPYSVFTSDKLDGWDDVGSPMAGAAVDPYFHALEVIDLYRVNLGRQSYDDKGALLTVSVSRAPLHASFSSGHISVGAPSPNVPSPLLSYAGAFDAIAHEFQHGVNASTLRFTDSPSSVAEGIHSEILEESMADIFAAFAEHWYRPGPGNVTIGEAVAAPGYPPTRDLSHPAKCLDVGCEGDDCAHRACPDHLSKLDPKADTHRGTGISSNAWYLMTLGGTNDTSQMTVSDPLGWDASLRVWYSLVQSRAAPPSSRFRDVAFASIALARHGVPGAGGGKAAACAWVAVGVLDPKLAKRFWDITC